MKISAFMVEGMLKIPKQIERIINRASLSLDNMSFDVSKIELGGFVTSWDNSRS